MDLHKGQAAKYDFFFLFLKFTLKTHQTAILLYGATYFIQTVPFILKELCNHILNLWEFSACWTDVRWTDVCDCKRQQRQWTLMLSYTVHWVKSMNKVFIFFKWDGFPPEEGNVGKLTGKGLERSGYSCMASIVSIDRQLFSRKVLLASLEMLLCNVNSLQSQSAFLLKLKHLNVNNNSLSV